MIARLKGTAHRLKTGEAIIDVAGVGYAVSMPIDAWEKVKDGDECTLWISTYVREDRLELFGFLDQGSRSLFELLISQSGIGPKMGLELCAVPRELLLQATEQNDPKLLSTVKGVGAKKAEKILIELKNMIEKEPEIFGHYASSGAKEDAYDQDAIDALTTLGYDTSTILNALKALPADLGSTEERVAASLRAL